MQKRESLCLPNRLFGAAVKETEALLFFAWSYLQVQNLSLGLITFQIFISSIIFAPSLSGKEDDKMHIGKQ